MCRTVRGLVQTGAVLVVLHCAGALSWAGGPVGGLSNNGVSRAGVVAASPNDPDFGEELLGDLVSAAASGVINAGLQGGLDWISYRRDPAQGLADPYVQNVIRLKQSASARVRVKAAVGLLRVPCPAASKPFLKEALKWDSSEEVRKTCAMALGRIGDEECCDYLQKAMKYDASQEVRLVCSAVLAKWNRAAVLK